MTSPIDTPSIIAERHYEMELANDDFITRAQFAAVHPLAVDVGSVGRPESSTWSDTSSLRNRQ